MIRELLKESLNEIPEYLDEAIFYLGKSYSIFSDIEKSLLFNGNHQISSSEFNKYLSMHRYKFQNTDSEVGGYAILKKKASILAMDIGPSPSRKFSNNYQSTCLSNFFLCIKLVSNSGIFKL